MLLQATLSAMRHLPFINPNKSYIMRTITALSMLLVLSASSCEKNLEQPVHIKPTIEMKASEVVEQTLPFSWDLFKEVNRTSNPGSNVVISPFSVAQAFGMVINGASDKNLEEMLSVFGFKDAEGLNEAYSNIREFLMYADPNVQLDIPNSVWYHKDFDVYDSFLQLVKHYYDAEIDKLDFRQEEAAKEVMNAWVNDATKGKISSIINSIPEEAVMYLINAVYFKGEWTNPFNENLTTDAPFFASSGEMRVKMMKDMGPYLSVFEKDYSAVNLPYGDETFSMTVILPSKGKSVDALVNNMSKVWSNINTKLTSRQVAVELPRIKIEAGYSLDRQLQELGIKQAFLDGFNFPGIANEKLRISNVIHKTFLEVNEKGTEAAAVTGIEMGVTSMPEYEEFRVNRPFVFVISEKSTGAILFAGKVEKPV